MQNLRNINFSRGIRSEEIQSNFEIIRDAIREERLRMSGYGVYKGFDIDKIDINKIFISYGELISPEGEAVSIPEQELDLPDLETVKEYDRQTIAEDRVYLTYFPQEIISVELLDIQQFIDYVSTEGNILHFHNQVGEVEVFYKTYKSTVHTIFVDPLSKTVSFESIESTSPSHVDLDQYKDKILIGAVRQYFDETGEGQKKIEIYNHLKDYCRIFVGKDGSLYINGERFENNRLLFDRPDPGERVLWYDNESNLLMAWSEAVGGDWIPVNDTSAMPYTEVKIWNPEDDDYPVEEFPQEFIFGEKEINMHFVPNHNQLQIVIDNSMLMGDQFEEIIGQDEYGFEVGVGFRLNKPLDRRTIVESRVIHSAQRGIGRRFFQRTATFVEDYFEEYNEDIHSNRSFVAADGFIIGENQLEVFVDGKRLNCLDPDLYPDGGSFGFFEKLTMRTKPGNKGQVGTYFEISPDVELEGTVVSNRVTLTVHSYDNLNKIMDNFEERFNRIKELIERAVQFQEDPRDFIQKGEPLDKDEVPQGSIKNNLLGGQFHIRKDPLEVIETAEISKEDLIFIFSDGYLLKRDEEYEVGENEKGCVITIHEPGNYGALDITGIKRGL